LAETLTEVLPESPQKNLAEEAKELANQYVLSQPDAVKKVRVLLDAAELDAEQILDEVKAQRAEQLAEEYARREPEATRLVKELLASSGRTIHDLMFHGFSANVFDEIERLDRLITIAETRRNISLREIERRRAVLGEALRRNVQEVEEGEFEVIETTPAEGQGPVQARRESRTATGRTLRNSRTAIAKSSKVNQAKGTIRRG
ncbi:hypothetical protein, partial [Bradyrhizobium sp.]|uniref:hypothetical protein n=1 Tax=Bradyrhizobium sp. TaxID=376 RepID=UPI003C622C5A